MKILRLQAENVKRLVAVDIHPNGSVVRINGMNGQGKTSVLDSIQLVLGWKTLDQPKVIRDGETHAEAVLDLGDLVAKRHWTANDKSYLEVKSKDGAKYPSPQAVLDKLVGTLSFDPLSFIRMDAKKQAATLRELVGVDTTALDAERQRLFDQRTAVNRDLGNAKARLVSLPEVAAPDEEVSVSDLTAEYQALTATLAANQRIRDEVAKSERQHGQATQRVTRAAQEVTRLGVALEQARRELKGAEAEAELFADSVTSDRERAAALVDPDLNVVAEKMKNVEATNRAVRAKKSRADESNRVAALETSSGNHMLEIAKVDADKAALLQAAKFPVEGLSFDDTGIVFNGLPLQQASAAEQLRVSLGMGLALNPKLKVILIRDGSLLDEKSLGMVAEMAEKADAQVWIEMVGTGTGASGIVIEDGQVAGPHLSVVANS